MRIIQRTQREQHPKEENEKCDFFEICSLKALSKQQIEEKTKKRFSNKKRHLCVFSKERNLSKEEKRNGCLFENMKKRKKHAKKKKKKRFCY